MEDIRTKLRDHVDCVNSGKTVPTIQGQTKFVPVDQDLDDDVEGVGLEETQCSEERKYATVNTKNDSQREKKGVSAVVVFFTRMIWNP